MSHRRLQHSLADQPGILAVWTPARRDEVSVLAAARSRLSRWRTGVADRVVVIDTMRQAE